MERVSISDGNYTCVEVGDFMNVKDFESYHILGESLIESPIQ